LPQRQRNSKQPETDHRKAQRSSARQKRAKHLWSADVTEHSDALDLENHIFARKPAEIAQSLKRSAERSHRRKTTPFQSAMSMLNFYINRAGKNLTAKRRHTLDRAKDELRKAFGRTK
jgi:hypothetical protein